MLNPDLPITKNSEDILNRSTFANSLAKTLLQYSFSSSLTIGLYGEWGSGKTSLLNMVLETVESKDSNTVILRFNPWLCSNSKQLITQFFKQLSAAIKLKKPKNETAWELIDQYADLFDAANMIPGAGTIISAFGKTLAKEAKEKNEQESNDLQGKKDKIITKMRDDDIRVIVSIDDIDRLTEEEIISVFQLVKALADFPNTIYILAFDYNVVVRALSKVQHGDGKEYLEKIIQVPFEIPAPCITDIYTALFSKLDVIFRDFPADKWPKDIWAELFQFGIKKYIKSIRDVIRYTKVISACTSRGSTLGKIVVKTRKVDLKYLEEFVNLDEAYNRIEKFVETDSFTHLTEDEKLNTILFLKTAKQQNKEDSSFGGVPEDALADWLEQTKH